MKARLSRRSFLRSASAVTAAQALVPGWCTLAPLPAQSAWVADEHGIHGLHGTGTDWMRTGFTPCDRPGALALHVPTHTLYVAHTTDTFDHLPTGSVSCYRFVPGKVGMQLLHRRALSLACVHPDALAVSPGGEMLIVASSQAGILNVLPLDENGRPSAVTAVRKDLSWGTRGQDDTATVGLSFVDARTLVASRASRAHRYMCTPDEIAAVTQEVATRRSIREVPHALAAAMQALVSNTSGAPMVWL